MGLLALLGKMSPLRQLYRRIVRYLPSGHNRQKRTEPDPGGTDIAHLVQLDHGVDAVVPLQNRLDLAGGDGVQPAAEAAELNQGHILMRRRKGGGMI